MKYLKKYNESVPRLFKTDAYKIKTHSAEDIKRIFSPYIDFKLVENIQYELTKYEDMGYYTNLYINACCSQINPYTIYSNEKWLSTMVISGTEEYEKFPYERIQYGFFITTYEIGDMSAIRKTKDLVNGIRMRLHTKYGQYLFDKAYEISAVYDDETDEDISKGYKVTITDLKLNK